MAQALTIFNSIPNLPADLAAFFEEESNITPKQTVPTLSYEGKVWTIGLNGEKTKLIKKDPDTGDESPVPIMRVVILDYNKQRGRAYYEGAYDPSKVAMPACWSDNGVTPAEGVKEPKGSACAKCPMSVKGSKVTEQGKSVTACSEHRMVVVVPAARLGFEPLRLKIAITSDYDGQSPDHVAQGWYAFKNYTDMLCANQVAHTAMLVTKMKFDPNVAYPKILFSTDKWLTAEQMAELVPIVKGEKVAALISGSWTPNGVDGERIEHKTKGPLDDKPTAAQIAEATALRKAKEQEAAAKAEAEARAKAEAEAAAAAEAGDNDDDDAMLPGEPATPAKAPPKAAAAKAPPKAAPAKPAKAAAAKTAEPAPPTAPADSALDDLLADWGT